jgi:hypothetical protein
MTHEIMDFFFLALFSLEWCLRVFASRSRYFSPSNDNFGWNLFDTFIIGIQVLESLLRLAFGSSSSSGFNTYLIRKFNIMRLLRLLRTLRRFRSVRQLHMLVYSVWMSLSTFFWSITALALVTFMFAVGFTEVVLNQKLHYDLNDVKTLDQYFGSMSRTMLSLAQAVSGGIDWGDLSEALASNEIYMTGVIPLIVYVAFATMAMMNIITGIFLETAMKRAEAEREGFASRQARLVFDKADDDQSGNISWPDFEMALADQQMKNFFETIDIDMSEAKTLFELLDVSGDGFVSAEDFITGCLRVRGSAKSLDLLVLSREVNGLFDKQRKELEDMGSLPDPTNLRSPHSLCEERPKSSLCEERPKAALGGEVVRTITDEVFVSGPDSAPGSPVMVSGGPTVAAVPRPPTGQSRCMTPAGQPVVHVGVLKYTGEIQDSDWCQAEEV